MTIYTFNEKDIICHEIYFEKKGDEYIKIAEWFFDENKNELKVINYRNRDSFGNYYKRESIYKGKDTNFWKRNKTRKYCQHDEFHTWTN